MENEDLVELRIGDWATYHVDGERSFTFAIGEIDIGTENVHCIFTHEGLRKATPEEIARWKT